MKHNCFKNLLPTGLVVVSVVCGLTACSDSLVSDVAFSRCGELPTYATRSRSVMYPEYLMITREGKNLHCAWHNYEVGCSSEDIYVKCSYKDNIIHITPEVVKSKGDIAKCVCTVSLYFTILGMEDDRFSVKTVYSGEKLLPVDLTGHKYCMIDLATTETVYDEKLGQMEAFYQKVIPEGKPMTPEEANGVKQEMQFDLDFHSRTMDVNMKCLLPCNAEQPEVRTYTEEDGSFVLSVAHDGNVTGRRTIGNENADCLSLYNVSFSLNNAMKRFHLKLNPHEIITIAEEGTKSTQTVYDYEGDIDFSSFTEISPSIKIVF